MKKVSRELKGYIGMMKEIYEGKKLDFDDVLYDLSELIEIDRMCGDTKAEEKCDRVMNEIYDIINRKDYKFEDYKYLFN